jgi:hypothetical protein
LGPPHLGGVARRKLTASVVFCVALAIGRREKIELSGWHRDCRSSVQLRPLGPHGSTGGEDIMNSSATITFRKSIAVLVTSMLGTLAGCGDAHGFNVDPGHIDPDSVAHLAAGIDGVDVWLHRYSTGCNAKASAPLTATVSDDMEFSSEQVKTLAPPCVDSPTPGVAVQLERRSIIFDFSNVEGSETFPDSEFEGYIIDLSRDDGRPVLMLAVVDRQLSTLDLQNEDLSHDYGHLELNFAGTTYDSGSYVKIDLFFADADIDTRGVE